MNGTQNEKILAQERLHWGIFALPVLAALATAFLTLLVLLAYHFTTSMAASMLSQIAPQRIQFSDNSVYVFAWLPNILVSAPVLLVTFIAYRKSIITLTNRRLIYRTGWVTRVSKDLPLENVDAIIIVEPLLGRLLGYGTVIVGSVGGLRFPFQFIGSPPAFHQLLQLAVKAAKTSEQQPQSAGIVDVPVQNDDLRYMPKR